MATVVNVVAAWRARRVDSAIVQDEAPLPTSAWAADHASMALGPLGLELSVDTGLRALCLRACGELDVLSTPLLDEALIDAEHQTPALLLLDLGGVEFMDGCGLHCLLAAARRCANRRIDLRIVGASRQVRRIIALTGTEARLPLGPIGAARPVPASPSIRHGRPDAGTAGHMTRRQ
jgi:anti-sigma B factor antagonist